MKSFQKKWIEFLDMFDMMLTDFILDCLFDDKFRIGGGGTL